jgi:hypothetical protein
MILCGVVGDTNVSQNMLSPFSEFRRIIQTQIQGPEDGDSMFLWNGGTHVSEYMTS